MKENNYDVFISYSRKDYKDENNNIIDNNVISKLKDVFKRNNISFWFDEDGIYSGDAFAPVIARNIRNAKIFIFVSSENSNKSEWTGNEIATAHEFKKKIIPFRVDDSTYNESVILYIAKLDYINYNINKEKALEQLVSSIQNYIEKIEKELLEKEQEKQRKANEEHKKAEEKKIQEQILAEQREKERLAQIATEKRRKEEELNGILMQISECDKKETELVKKRISIEGELKEIETEIQMVSKNRDSLLVKRKYIESELIDNVNSNIAKIQIKEKKTLSENISNNKRLKNIAARQKVIWIGLSGIFIILLISFWIHQCNSTIEIEEESTYTEPESNDFTPQTPIKELRILDKETDCVYGIETIDKIQWDSLYVMTDSDRQTLHPISFALIIATSGKNDYYGNIYEENRKEAKKHGIRVASYHLLNIKPTWKYATGKAQANNYISHVGALKENELPPVLSIPAMNHEEKDVAIERCQDWLTTINNYYKVKPIIFISQSDYNDYFKQLNMDNAIWIPTEDKTIPNLKFQKRHYVQTCLYNGKNKHESLSKNGRLSIFLGTYEEFMEYENPNIKKLGKKLQRQLKQTNAANP